MPWTAIDLETAFLPSPRKGQENVQIQQTLFEGTSAVTSPEKKMTVEGWLRWRAAQSEEQLKQTCERMVSLFEIEGTRALQVVGGIEVRQG